MADILMTDAYKQCVINMETEHSDGVKAKSNRVQQSEHLQNLSICASHVCLTSDCLKALILGVSK